MGLTNEIIPHYYPDILKAYTKLKLDTNKGLKQADVPLATRGSVLEGCLANGSYPPVKHRIEFQYNNKNSLFSEITPGMLRILHRHMGTSCKIQTQALTEKWKEVGFPKEFLEEVLQTGGWRKGDVDWLRFIGSVCYKITENLDESLIAACYVLSENTLPCCFTFGQYRYIALHILDRHSELSTEAYLEKVNKIEKISSHQGGMIYMENIKMII